MAGITMQTFQKRSSGENTHKLVVVLAGLIDDTLNVCGDGRVCSVLHRVLSTTSVNYCAA